MNAQTEIIDDDEHGGANGIRLCALKKKTDENRREIAFGTGGDPGGAPVLLFPPLGPAGNRRMIASFHEIALENSFQLICVNRPGTGSTSDSLGGGPERHVEAACQDIVDVLDALRIEEKVGLLFLCAGTPFALAFVTRHAERVDANKMLGIAPFVSPADCRHTKPLFQFGARHCPLWLISPMVGSVFGSIASSIRFVPESRMIRGMQRHLSEEECAIFQERFLGEDNESDSFSQQFHWMLHEGRKGTSADVAVLLSPGREVGIEYNRIKARVRIFHGEEDALTPLPAALWLSEELPASTVQVLSKGTHEGSLFLLHTEILEGLKLLSSKTTSK